MMGRRAMLFLGVGLVGCPLLMVVGAAARHESAGPRAPQPTVPVAGRAAGWQRLQEVLAPDGAEQNWQWWSNKCYAPPDALSGVSDPRMTFNKNCEILILRTGNSARRAALGSPQAPGVPQLASVLFNKTAAQFIMNNRLSLPLPGKPDPLQPVVGQELSIPDFPSTSTIVKAIWELVWNEGTRRHPIWKLRVYDPTRINWANDQVSQQLARVHPPGEPGWTTQLTLNTAQQSSCPFGDGKAPADLALDTTVPLGCFVHFYMDDKTPGALEVRTLTDCPECLPAWGVLVGLHIAHREDDHWTWTTLWWTNNPSKDQDHFADQASILPGLKAQYTHFAMNTSYANSGPLYNPYLEGTESNGTQSVCANCHALAAIRLYTDTQPEIGLPLPGQVPADYFANSRTTDHVWTIAAARNSFDPQTIQTMIRKKAARQPPLAPRQ